MSRTHRSNRTCTVLAALGAAALASAASAQLAVEDLTTLTPNDLVQTLLGPDSGAAIGNVTYTGAPEAAGRFSGGTGIVGFEDGIVLTSGFASNVIGPNVADDITGDNQLPGDPDLDVISGKSTNDATVLEFEFECENVQVISFQYVFASDEYNEFVDSQFNDVFAFFLNGENIALLEDGVTPVAINTINCGNPYAPPAGGMNCDLFINNDLDDGGGALDTEMDGLTVVLGAQAMVEPGVNTIRLAIADASDFVLDSAVFIRAGSFNCAPLPPEDDCALPGRPSDEGLGDRMLRGYVVGWAVDAENREIRWNHLAATATVIDYRDGAAAEYPAYTVQAVADVEHGMPLGTPGDLLLDGAEYGAVYDTLTMPFFADGVMEPCVGGPMIASVRSDLTLMPVSMDLVREGEPVSTKAEFTVWNENEVKFSGMSRCITCWDETLFTDYAQPNHFVITALQTQTGRLRVRGVGNADCPGSVDAALLGTMRRRLAIENGPAYTAAPLYGMGVREATIRYEPLAPPEEAPAGTSARRGTAVSDLLQDAMPDDAAIAAGLGLPTSATRVSTDKGSLFIIPKVEIVWDENGQVVQDTFVTVVNDFPEDVSVQLYFVNGDPPRSGVPVGCPEPGWNMFDNLIHLTKDQTVWWSSVTGQTAGVAPFTVLDPGE